MKINYKSMKKFSNKISIESLQRISIPEGDVLKFHSLNDKSFSNFGEAYFSFIKKGAIKSWKKHTKVTSNLVVPYGRVKFVFFDGSDNFHQEILDDETNKKLIVKPGLWFGFKGLNYPHSVIMNLIDEVHDPDESEKMNYQDIEYDWNEE